MKHLDTDPTSAALREVDAESKATGDMLKGKRRRAEKNKAEKREKSYT